MLPFCMLFFQNYPIQVVVKHHPLSVPISKTLLTEN